MGEIIEKSPFADMSNAEYVEAMKTATVRDLLLEIYHFPEVLNDLYYGKLRAALNDRLEQLLSEPEE